MQALQDRTVGNFAKPISPEAGGAGEEGGNGDEEEGENVYVSDDGRVEMLRSLEGFDLEKFKIVPGKH